MKKSLLKITGASLGFALAIGTGALLLSRNEPVKVSASDAVAASCDFTTKAASCTGYSKVHTYGDYEVYGGQNSGGSWDYFKFGAKKAASSDPTKVTEGYIKSNVSIAADITKVEVVLLASNVNSNITWSLDVSNDASFTSPTTIDKGTLTHKTAGSYYAAPASGTFGVNKYYRVNFHIENTTTTNGTLWVSKVNFHYESSVERGALSIGGLDTAVFTKGGTKTLTADWDPLSSGATLSSHTFSSTDTDVFTFSGDTLTAVGPGSAKITLSGVDSNSEAYVVTSDLVFVTETYDFVIGDNVALCAPGVTKELSSVTTYGTGEDYSTSPNGTYLLNVEAGSEPGSLSFLHGEDYLSWSSGNTLATKTTKDANSSWYVVNHGDYYVIANASTPSREIWWNNGTPRFACYEGKTPTTSGYNSVSLVKIEEAPIRGTFTLNSFTESYIPDNCGGFIQYTFTPAEGDSATIDNIIWTSSNTDALTVDNTDGSYCAQSGGGKVTVSYVATDSNGQEYTGSSKEFTVLHVVYGDYEKVTSVADGDTVAIVCDSLTYPTIFSGVDGEYGSFLFYSEHPTGVYDFTLEESGDYFALKTSEDKYLSWKSDGKLELKDDTSSEKSLWSIAFDGEGNAEIANKALDGDSHRQLMWNKSTPRFGAYKSGQTAVQLYAPASSYEENTVTFAQMMLDYSCDASGETAPDADVWENTLKEYFEDSVSAAGKLQLQKADAVEHVSPSTDKEKVEAAMAKYDYIVGKYLKGLEIADYEDFIGRNPAALPNVIASTQNNRFDADTTIIVITVVAITSITSIGVLLALKRKKHF